MIIYQDTKLGFLNDVSNNYLQARIEAAFLRKTGPIPSDRMGWANDYSRFRSPQAGSGEFARDAYRELRDAPLNDVLILSMANEYRLAHPADNVAIVTEDRRIVDICRAFRDDFPRGVRISTQNAV